MPSLPHPEAVRGRGATGNATPARFGLATREADGDWLATHFPDRAARVMHHITSMRGGKDNDPRFFARFQAQGPYADLMRQRFVKACTSHGLSRELIQLDCTRFQTPGDQFSLFP